MTMMTMMRKKSKCCSALTSDTRRLASTFPKSVVHVVKLCTSAEDYEGCHVLQSQTLRSARDGKVTIFLVR